MSKRKNMVKFIWKSFCTIGIAFLSLTCVVSISAASENTIQNNTESQVQQPEVLIENQPVTIIQADDPTNQAEVNHLINENIAKQEELNLHSSPIPKATCVISFFLIRSGNTTSCQLYMRHTGTMVINAFKWYSDIIVRKTASTSSTKYLSLSGRTSYFTASAVGTVPISPYFSVPVSLKSVYVKIPTTYVYALSSGWESSDFNPGGPADIN